MTYKMILTTLCFAFSGALARIIFEEYKKHTRK